jgi:hypothetical protein
VPNLSVTQAVRDAYFFINLLNSNATRASLSESYYDYNSVTFVILMTYKLTKSILKLKFISIKSELKAPSRVKLR